MTLSGRFVWPFLLLGAVGLGGCANPGPPLPPSLMLPQPVGDLLARRVANTVALHWTMPSRSTDRVALRGEQKALVCRAADAGPCATVGTISLLPGTPGKLDDVLPVDLRTGPLRLLRYQVRVQNRREKDVGVSNPAFTAAGWAPPEIRSASATAVPKGVRVRWSGGTGKPEGEAARLVARLVRKQTGQAAGNGGERASTEAQTLETRERWTPVGGGTWLPDQALDPSAPLNHSYRYRVTLVTETTLDGHTLEIEGEPADTPVIAARDVFPPAVPEGLQAAANPEGHTIDLSWNPDTEPDLAGYFVYRRVAGSAGQPERISGKMPVPTPGWSDTTAQSGVAYAYSVSAVDASGNESAHSQEATAALDGGGR